jgi:hypothetical protein
MLSPMFNLDNFYFHASGCTPYAASWMLTALPLGSEEQPQSPRGIHLVEACMSICARLRERCGPDNSPYCSLGSRFAGEETCCT